MTAHENLVGRRFGRLVVTSQATTTARFKRRWWVLCDCGQKTIAQTDNLYKGAIKSCGCLKRETGKVYVQRMKKFHSNLGTLTIRRMARLKG